MKTENQVCTLEQAQRLRELECLALCQFAYIETPAHGCHVKRYWRDNKHSLIEACTTVLIDDGSLKWWYAPNVAELGIMLPPFFKSLMVDRFTHCFCVNERVDTFPLLGGSTEFDTIPAYILNKELVPMQTGTTEAQARTGMLIHLIEQKYITIEEIALKLSEA